MLAYPTHMACYYLAGNTSPLLATRVFATRSSLTLNIIPVPQPLTALANSAASKPAATKPAAATTTATGVTTAAPALAAKPVAAKAKPGAKPTVKPKLGEGSGVTRIWQCWKRCACALEPCQGTASGFVPTHIANPGPCTMSLC